VHQSYNRDSKFDVCQHSFLYRASRLFYFSLTLYCKCIFPVASGKKREEHPARSECEQIDKEDPFPFTLVGGLADGVAPEKPEEVGVEVRRAGGDL